MPFLLGGDYEPPSQKPDKPMRVTKVKRKKGFVTLIEHIPLSKDEIKNLCSKLKKKLATGGSNKENSIELQGDKVDLVKKELKDQGFKIR